MLLPCVVLNEPQDNNQHSLTTRIVYSPEVDGFFVQQGDEVTSDPDCPIDGSIFLSLPQFVQLFETLRDEEFINAMQMARHDYTGKNFH